VSGELVGELPHVPVVGGSRVSLDGVRPGVYMVKTGGRAGKLVVR
jgi:hypothetical protein